MIGTHGQNTYNLCEGTLRECVENVTSFLVLKDEELRFQYEKEFTLLFSTCDGL